MTTEPETVRPEDLKPGDRVRVAFEGVIDEDGDLPLPAYGLIPASSLAHATITRLPPPVDPDLLLAREAAASDDPVNRYSYLVGGLDKSVRVRIALAAIKLAKEQS